MVTINLRDYYPWYQKDSNVIVSDDIAGLLHEFELDEAAFQLRVYRYKAYFSLDCNDGIENKTLEKPLTLSETYEHKLMMARLHNAVVSLPDKQAKRIYAHFFLGMSKTKIACIEGVHKSQITRSISKALRSMKIFLENYS